MKSVPNMYMRSKLAILNYLNKTEQDLNESVKIIADWFNSQPHLPESPDKNRIEFFLLNNKLNIANTKQRLDAYYTMRTSLTTVFKYSNPSTPEMQSTIDSAQIVPLPKQLDNLYGVMVLKLRKHVPPELDPHWWLAAVINAHEVNIQENLMLNYVLIYDQENLTIEHVLKITPMFIINCVKMAEKGLGNRLKAIHFINNPPVFQLALKIIKALIRPDLYERLHLHSTLDSFRHSFPADVLPKDYGGNEKYLKDLEEIWMEKYKDYKKYFDNLDTLKVNEELRPNTSFDLFDLLPFNFRNILFD